MLFADWWLLFWGRDSWPLTCSSNAFFFAAVSFLEGFFEACCGDVLPFRVAALGFVMRFLLP
jgi:hypothetical protein